MDCARAWALPVEDYGAAEPERGFYWWETNPKQEARFIAATNLDTD